MNAVYTAATSKSPIPISKTIYPLQIQKSKIELDTLNLFSFLISQNRINTQKLKGAFNIIPKQKLVYVLG